MSVCRRCRRRRLIHAASSASSLQLLRDQVRSVEQTLDAEWLAHRRRQHRMAA